MQDLKSSIELRLDASSAGGTFGIELGNLSFAKLVTWRNFGVYFVFFDLMKNHSTFSVFSIVEYQLSLRFKIIIKHQRLIIQYVGWGKLLGL